MDSTSAPPSRPYARALLPALVAIVTVSAFLPSLRGEFLLWDDDANFTYNEHYRGFRPENLRWMFTDTLAHYMPLTWLSCALDYVLWGMNPAGYHATNLALHTLNAILFYFVLRILLRRGSPDLAAPALDVAAVAGALCFSIHPLRVESVAWITERRDVLSGVFFLLTLLAYLKMTEASDQRGIRIQWMVLSALAFTAMLLSKVMGFTLPLVLLVLDIYPLRRFSKASLPALLREKIPLLALMIGGFVMISITSSRAGGMSDREHYPLIQSLARPGYALTFYLAKTLLPVGLSPLYWYRPALGLPQVVGWIALLGLTVLAFLQRRRFPAALAAWMAYGLLMSPGSGLVSLGYGTGADHFTYLPCLPFAAAGAALVALLSRRFPAPALGAASAVVVLALSAATWRYCGVWKDSVSLWSRAVELESDVYFSHANLGRSYAGRGEWDRAIQEYDRALDLEKRWFEPYGHRARARLVRGNAAGAIEDANAALLLKPGWGEALVVRGMAFGALGKPREALADYSRALQDRPQFVEARIQRAVELAKAGDFDGALADLDAAVAFDPQPTILVRRGITRGMKEDLPGAAADFRRALDLAPPGWPQRRQVEEFLRRAGGSK